MQHGNHLTRVSKCEEYEDELNLSGIKYPIDINDIGKFEHQNNINIIVFGYEDKKIFSLRITTMTIARHHVDSLYFTADETSHYVLVKDLSRLASSQYNNHNGKHYFCQYWLHGCTSEEVLKNHLGKCKLHGAQRIKLPEADDKKGCDKVKFTKTEYQLRLTFVIYEDFESVLRKQDSCEPSSSKLFTNQYQHHVPCESCIYVKCSDGLYFELTQLDIGDDAAEKFLDQVLAVATICRQQLASKIPMKWLTQEQWKEHNNATNCSICAKPFKLADKKVLDHDHLTGEYRGTAHNA